MARIRISFSILLFLAAGARAMPVSNGGFEEGMMGWTTAVKPGVAGAFQTIIEKRHGGGNCLQVTIGGSGIRDSLATLTTDSYAWDTSRIYMVRFWGIAKNRAAMLDLRIGTGAGARRCHFEIYDSDGPWHMYQYLFKPAAANAPITFNFSSPSTYWFDDVEVVDDRDPVLDLGTQFMWQSAHVGYGWISGDNDVSIPLPDGRNAWILNDSFIGMLNKESNVLKDVKMITNLIILQDTKPTPSMTTLFAGTQAEPKALFGPTAFTLYWISDALIAGGKLQVLLQEWNWAYKFTNSAFVGTMSLPDLKIESLVKTRYAGSDIPNAMLADKDFTYVYSVDRTDSTSRYTRVARIPPGMINPQAPWEFLTLDGAWSTDFAKAGRVIKDVEIASAVKLGDSNYVFSGMRHLGQELQVRFSKTPFGPWTPPVNVHVFPEEAGILPYLGHIHKGTRQGGTYTLSASLFPNKGGWNQQISDRGCYLPQYVRVDLETLSPYTKRTPTALGKAPGRGLGKGKAKGFSWTGRRLRATP